MRLFEDGFDHYGTSLSNMLDGTYAQAGGGAPNGRTSGLRTNLFATGGTSYYHGTGPGLTTFEGLRKVLPAAKDKLGVAMRVYFPQFTAANSAGICHMHSANANVSQLSFIVDANGAIVVHRGLGLSGTDGGADAILGTTDPILVTSAWNHVEMQAYIHDTDGWVRIAVNGVHRYELTGIDTKYDSTNVASIGQSLSSYASPEGDFYHDDYYIYDFEGDSSVDTDFCPATDASGMATNYIGDLQVWPLLPNGDTAEADFLPSTGTSSYTMIDEHSPDDTDYIYSVAAGDLSEFDLDDLPVEITYIRGLGIHARLSKADAGAAFTKVGMKSVAAFEDAAERPLTVEPTYWRDQIDKDPNSNARWTRDSLNAALLRVTRTI
jgi:hypothetical protein